MGTQTCHAAKVCVVGAFSAVTASLRVAFVQKKPERCTPTASEHLCIVSLVRVHAASSMDQLPDWSRSSERPALQVVSVTHNASGAARSLRRERQLKPTC